MPDERRFAGRKKPAARPKGPPEPHIPDDVTVEELEPAAANELRTLPEGLADIVGRHLVAADRALVDEDYDLARSHAAAAKRRAGRVAVVREAVGVCAYLAGDYAEALTEFRAVRRMTGTDEYAAMIADCERGLGRPEKALEELKQLDTRKLDPAQRVEVLLVAAGARADMGQLDAALLVLQVPELTSPPAGDARARLQYAYSDLLERLERTAEAKEWMRRAADSDVEGVTDAVARLDEGGDVQFDEERAD